MIQHLKRLANQVIIYGLGDTISKIAILLTLPIFARFLTPADYGVASILTVTNTLIVGVADLGLTNGIFRFFYHEKQKNKLISTAQIAMTTFTLAVCLVGVLFAKDFAQYFFKNSAYSYVVILNFLSIPLMILVTAPLCRFRAEEKAKLYTGINTARVVLGILLNVVLIVFFKRGLNGLFEGPLLNAALFAIIIGSISLKENGLSFSKEKFKEMLHFGLPFLLAIAFFWILDWVDRFFLIRMTNLSEVGLYTLGYNIGMAIMLPVGAFSTAWAPFYMTAGKDEGAKKVYSLIFTYYSLVIGFLVLLIVTFAPDYFRLFTPAEYHLAYTVVPLITLAYALKGNFLIICVGSLLVKKPFWQFISEGIAAVLNVIAMLILIPYLGRMGAAWATLIAYVSMPVSLLIFSKRFYHVKYEYVRVGKIVAIGLITYYLMRLIYQPTNLNMLFRGLILAVYPLLFYVIGFFDQKELKKIRDLKDKLFKALAKKPQKIKVFLGPFNGGLNYSLKNSIENELYQVTTFSFSETKFNFQDDINLRINRFSRFKAAFLIIINFCRSLRYKIYHFRFGRSLMPFDMDLPILRLLGKKVIMVFDGTDLRQLDRFQDDKFNKIFAQNLEGTLKSDRGKRLRYKWVKMWANKIVVSTPDLLPFAPEAELIGNVLPDLAQSDHQAKKTGYVTILHAPTNRKIKGTKYLLRAIKKLEKEKIKVKLDLLEGDSHQDLARHYQKADIVVDQLLIGAYGVVAIESMSFGKPTICYIREDLKKVYPHDLPIVSANPENCYEIIKELVLDASRRAKIGKKSVKYVQNYHSAAVIGQKWRKVYKELL